MNKIISFVLGLIVVVVVLLLITGRLGLFKGRNFFTVSRGNTTATPAPTKTAEQAKKATPTPRRVANNTVSPAPTSAEKTDADDITTIPNTGASTNLLLFSIVVLISGVFLRKTRVTS